MTLDVPGDVSERPYPHDLNAILETTREIAKTIVARNAEAVDAESRWPEEAIRALQAAGLGGLTVPAKFGGLGHGSYAVAQVCEILGQECASTAMCFGMHCVGSAVLSAKATPDQQRRYLEPIVAGEHLTTLSLSEAGTGSHFYIPNTQLVADGDGYCVSGTKTFVTNGSYADSYVISTVAAAEDGPIGQFSCVVVPKEAQGLSWGDEWSGMGMRGNSSRSLSLQGVAVPGGDLLGEKGD